MNHLCGLPSSTSDDHFWSTLSDEDATALKKFRTTYNASRPPTSDDTDKPRFLVTTNELPACGWRPLDDITLYRFLCADVVESSRSGKKFQPDVSLDRLLRALQFRKDQRVDDLLQDIVDNESCNSTTIKNKEPSSSTQLVPPEHQQPRASFVRMASGTLSACGKRIQVLETVPTHETQKQLLRQRTFSTSSLSRTPEEEEESVTTASSSIPVLVDLDMYQKLRVRVFTGRGYEKYPVLFERVGDFLGSGNCAHFTDDEWCRFYIWDMERHFVEMRKCATDAAAETPNGRSVQRPISQYTFCGDCSGVVSSIMNGSVWNVVPLLKVLVGRVEDFYPEIAFRILLFNVPRVATMLFRAVKAFLDPVTASKIVLVSGLPTSKQFGIPIEAIPKEYGGKSVVEYPKTTMISSLK